MAGRNLNAQRKTLLGVLLVVTILSGGFAGRFLLGLLREPPRQVEIKEMALRVEALKAAVEDAVVVITGYSTAMPLGQVTIMPKVAGEIVEKHPQLKEGEVLPAGAVMFKIDPTDYVNTKTQAQAQVSQLENTLALLNERFKIDQGRRDTFQRTRDIASEEYERDKALYEKDDIGTESMVNLSEVNYNQAKDALEQLEQALKLYPFKIKEAESGLSAAKAQLLLAETSLERCEVKAPFTGRVKVCNVEIGQVVAPGAPVVMLADDSALEMSVPLDGRDAQLWLPFQEAQPSDGTWFAGLQQVECRVFWTEDTGNHSWPATLQRVEKYDPMTRTLTVAVRVDGKQAALANPGLPLVDGMFCRIDIPGKPMQGVYRVPRWAVSYDGEVYVAEDNRLKKRKVEVVRTQGEDTFIRGGVSEGDTVIVTRLVNPLPGSLLDISFTDGVKLETAASAPASAGEAAGTSQ